MLQRTIRSLTLPTALIGIGGFVAISGLWTCPIHAATGLYCPGCGGTRAVFALAHADVASALHQNALALLALPLAVLALTRRSRIPAWIDRHQALMITAAAMVMMTFTVARNTIAPGLAPY